MSLVDSGSSCSITTLCEVSGNELKVGEFKEERFAPYDSKRPAIEREKELFRKLFESYLNSEQFPNDVYHLEQTIRVEFKRFVHLSI